MRFGKIEIAGKKVFPIGTPSGCVATDPMCAANLMDGCEEYGTWTAKSASLYPKVVPEGDEVENPDSSKEYGCREPILVKTGFRRRENAVGLTNPGAKVMARMIQEAGIPKDRLIIGSVFGKTLDDYVEAAVILQGAVDMIEGNYSCPNSEKEGMVFGQDPETVFRFTKAIVDAINMPFLAKLTPNMDNVDFGIGDIAKAAIDAGAYGIVLINTSGPNENPHLYFGRGGESGAGISNLRIRCLNEVREAIGPEPFIQGGGGIFSARDAKRDFENGANAITMGTALFGMREKGIAGFLRSFVYDLRNGTDSAGSYLRDIDMGYKKVKIRRVINGQSDFKVFETDTSIDALPGQFVFAMLPEIGNIGKPGEKPFSIMDNDPLTLGVLARGYFTGHFNNLRGGDSFFYKGPCGQGVDVPRESDVVLVGGGCGIAGLYLLVKQFSGKANVTCLLGAKDNDYLPYLDEFKRHSDVHVITDNKGMVSDLFESVPLSRGSYFFNCGPRAMMDAVLPLELEITGRDRVCYSVDRITRCGEGACGSCVDDGKYAIENKGKLTCREGPFMSLG